MAAEAISEGRTGGDFWDGVRLSMPVVVASAPFAVLFGTIAVDNGFSVLEAFLMSAMIYGGASQMVGIELFGQHVAPWLIVLSIFAVNFRHVLYSAGIGRRIAHWPVLQQALGYFLGLVLGFRKRPLWAPVVAASAVASIIAYRTVGSPWHVSIGAIAGVLLAVILPPHHSGVGKRP